MKTIRLWQFAMMLLLATTTIAQQSVVPQQDRAAGQPNESATITELRAEIADIDRALSEKTKTIAELQHQLFVSQSKFADVRSSGEFVSVAGLSVAKQVYDAAIGGILLILISLTGWYFFKYRNANRTTIKAVDALSNLEEEHQEHLRISLEREQKLRRQLQDELNRNKIAAAS